MKKTFVLFAIACVLIMNNAMGQLTAVSVANGNWTSSSTWDCSGLPCVPTAGYDVTINTAVILDMDFVVLNISNSLTINAGGTLIEDATPRSITISSTGSVTSAGDLTVSNFTLLSGTFTTSGNGATNITDLSNSGVVQNGATMTATNTVNSNGFSITNSKTLTLTNFMNLGTFTNDMTMLFSDITNSSTGTFTNSGGSTMIGTNFLNLGTLTNNGYMSMTDFTSWGGVTYNNLSIIPSNNCWTNGSFWNSASGFISVGNDYAHGDTTSLFNGWMTNDGRIEVGNDFGNFDTIKGSGSICVADLSLNAGWFLGTFDFCDTTSLLSGGSVDLNTGVIDSSISNCTGTACFTLDPLGIENTIAQQLIKIYPNPAGDQLNIQLEKNETVRFELFNVAGQQVLDIDEGYGSHFSIDLSGLKAGCYLLKSTNADGAYVSQVIVKQ